MPRAARTTRRPTVRTVRPAPRPSPAVTRAKPGDLDGDGRVGALELLFRTRQAAGTWKPGPVVAPSIRIVGRALRPGGRVMLLVAKGTPRPGSALLSFRGKTSSLKVEAQKGALSVPLPSDLPVGADPEPAELWLVWNSVPIRAGRVTLQSGPILRSAVVSANGDVRLALQEPAGAELRRATLHLGTQRHDAMRSGPAEFRAVIEPPARPALVWLTLDELRTNRVCTVRASEGRRTSKTEHR